MLSRKQIVVFRCFVLFDHIYPTNLVWIFECHFRYGDIVWGNYGETLLNKLQKNQNRAARIISGSDYDAPSEPLLLGLGWRNIWELILLPPQARNTLSISCATTTTESDNQEYFKHFAPARLLSERCTPFHKVAHPSVSLPSCTAMSLKMIKT